MKYRVLYSTEALQDMDAAWEYIFVELCNPDAAERIVNMIMDMVELLVEQPFIGTSLNAIVDVESDYRFLACESYLTFYRIEDAAVYIDRVLHETQDYMRVLFVKK